ncbi:MAG: purine nucleoside permease [Acidobacteria bacterium]|nr:purine nucleoside permease [Acidobacteriota bacterium]
MINRILALILFLSITSHCCAAGPKAIPVKVVVITMFEVGNDTGDTPGELQYWVERDHLDQIYPMPDAYHSVRMNNQGEMAILTGSGTAHAAATVMAVGLDPRFDFSRAFWIVAGIAGGNPNCISLGSAAWARYVVDGDLGYEIDSREIPRDWSTGYIPLRKTRPFEPPATPPDGQAYELDASLTQWAFSISRNTSLPDSDTLKAARSSFDGAAAQRPPFVAIGDTISSSTFWHGKLNDAWANEWISYFTGGKGQFNTTGMEDTGTLQSLKFLAAVRRADWHRILVLRSVSNYDQQPRGMTAAESLAHQRIGTYSAYLPALEGAYRVGHAVAEVLLHQWPKNPVASSGTHPTTQETLAKPQ